MSVISLVPRPSSVRKDLSIYSWYLNSGNLDSTSRPFSAFQHCTRKVGEPGIRSHVQYVTLRRVKIKRMGGVGKGSAISRVLPLTTGKASYVAYKKIKVKVHVRSL